MQLSISNQKVEQFLYAVDKFIIQIGVREHIDFIRVLKSRNHWSASELRASVSAILSTNSDQYRQIGVIFDKYILNHEQNKSPDLYSQLNLKKENFLKQNNEGESKQSFIYKIFGDFFRNNLRSSVIVFLILFFLILLISGTIIYSIPSPITEIQSLITSNRQIGSFPKSEIRHITNDEKTGSFQKIVSSFPKIVIQQKQIPPKVSKKEKSNDNISKDNTKQPKFEILRILVEPEKKMLIDNSIDRQSFRRELIADDWYTLILFWLFTTISLRFWKLSRTSRLEESLRIREKLMKTAVDEGEKLYNTYNVPAYKPISKSILDDAAFIFGRLYRQERGSELDIQSTLDKTVKEAGMFNPHFKAGTGIRELLVLIDIERGDHPWLSGFERSLDYLAKIGVKMIKFRFQYIPSRVISEDDGTTLTFKDLHRKFSDDILLIFSRNLSVKDREGYADWINDLKYWKIKAWIDPEPKRYGAQYQRKDIYMFEKLGLKTFPFTNEGITHLAVYLSSEGHSTLSVTWPVCSPIEGKKIQKALESWAVCASIVPDANWDQLEAIRRNPDFPEVSSVFTEPWHIQLLIDWISKITQTNTITQTEATSGDGRTLAIDMKTVDQLIRKQRQADKNNLSRSPLEKRMRQLLLNQLEFEYPDNKMSNQLESDPNKKMSKYLWELKVAEHLMTLEPEQTERLMNKFAGSPVEIEASQVLKIELKRQDDGYLLDNQGISSSMKKRLQLLKGGHDGVEVHFFLRVNFRSWIKPMIVSLILTLMLGMAILISGYAKNPWDILYRGNPSELKVIIPNTHKIITNISKN